MKEKLKLLTRQEFWYYVLIFLMAICLCIPLFQDGMYSSHDGEFHTSRALGTIEQLQNGESPFIIERFSNELGFAWNLFYPPVSTVITSVFGFILGNVVIGMKIFIFLTFFLSGFFMYRFIRTLTRNTWTDKKIGYIAALLVSLFYMAAPYRMLNTYTRLAVGEMAAFIFIPIIFEGVYLLLQGETKKAYLFVLGAVGLILSHNISTMLIFVLGFFYVLINIKKLKNPKILKTLLTSAVIIILSVLFFEIPLLEQKTTAEYEVFRYGKMYTPSLVQSHALNPLQLFYRHADGPDNSMYFCIGIPILLGLIVTPFVWKRLKQKYKREYKFFLIIGIICTFMATFLFPWFILPDLFLMIQFPWRLLGVITFCFSIVGGINFALLFSAWQEKTKKRKLTIPYIGAAILIISSLLYALSFVTNIVCKPQDNEYYKEKEIIDTKYQVSRYSSFLEYWPQKAIDSIDYVTTHDHKVHILRGKATISDEGKENGKLSFSIKGEEKDTFIELPYLFYKGYQIKYSPKDSNEVILLEAEESEHGLVGLKIDSNIDGKIQVEYHMTILHKICFVISSLTMVSYVLYLMIRRYQNKRTKILQEAK